MWPFDYPKHIQDAIDEGQNLEKNIDLENPPMYVWHNVMPKPYEGGMYWGGKLLRAKIPEGWLYHSTSVGKLGAMVFVPAKHGIHV